MDLGCLVVNEFNIVRDRHTFSMIRSSIKPLTKCLKIVRLLIYGMMFGVVVHLWSI